MNLVLRVAVTAAAVWVAIWLVPGLDFHGGFWAFLVVSVLMVVANTVVKPILNVLSLPLIVLSLGLFLLITNALVLQIVIWLSGDVFQLGLTSTGFFWATFLGALVVSVVRAMLERVVD